MKITKYQHACLLIEKDGTSLVIDPGEYSDDFVVPQNVVAVIVTHQHSDHADPHKIAQILEQNPEAILLIGPNDTLTKLDSKNKQIVTGGDKLSVGGFNLKFFGGQHAIIHSSLPTVENVGILVDDKFYYPGDSFTLPNVPVDTLALPVSAPWLKISETIDFMLAVKPRLAFQTHDILLSDEARGIVTRVVGGFAQKAGIDLRDIYGSPIEI